MRVYKEGQIKKGDRLVVLGNSDIDDQITTAKEVITIDGREEIIINKRKNKYFITSMVVDGTSWANSVHIL